MSQSASVNSESIVTEDEAAVEAPHQHHQHPTTEHSKLWEAWQPSVAALPRGPIECETAGHVCIIEQASHESWSNHAQRSAIVRTALHRVPSRIHRREDLMQLAHFLTKQARCQYSTSPETRERVAKYFNRKIM